MFVLLIPASVRFSTLRDNQQFTLRATLRCGTVIGRSLAKLKIHGSILGWGDHLVRRSKALHVEAAFTALTVTFT